MSATPRPPRPARAADLPTIVALLEGEDLPLAGLGNAALWVQEGDDREPAGVVGLERHAGVGLLRSLAVAPDQRGSGIGARLVEEAMAAARTGGLRAVYVLTTTAGDWFEGRGFSRVDRAEAPPELADSAELQGACPADAALLVRRLEG